MSNRAPSSSERDARGRLLPGHQKLGGRRRWTPPRSLALAEAETVGELYERLVRQFDSGKLTPAAVKAGVELVRLKATIVSAEDMERRLQALEAGAAKRGMDAEDE